MYLIDKSEFEGNDFLIEYSEGVSSTVIENIKTDSTNSIPVLFVDVETTGVSYATDRVIQVSCQPAMVDLDTGELVKLLGPKTQLHDPGIEIPDEVVQLTGITNEQIKGQRANWEWLRKVMGKVEFVIAHNAQFDKHFIYQHFQEEGITPPSDVIWACSMTQIDWRGLGCRAGKSLETLAAWHGFYYSAHSAEADVHALINLLFSSGRGYMLKLIQNASKSQWRVFAVNFPRDKNAELKSRKYRWDPDVSMWWKGFKEKEDTDTELAWLQEFNVEGQVFEVLPQHAFN